jgi:hypothetical protein
MAQTYKYGLLLVVLLSLISCKTTEEVAVSEQGTVARNELVVALDSLSHQSFDSYYSKIATTFKDSSRSFSFKTSTWMIADSASNFLITFARFPVVGALVTRDSVHVTNRREKCYTNASLNMLSEQFGTELTLRNLQEILLGIPTNFDSEKTYYQTNSDNGLTLCTHGLKDIQQIRLENSDDIITYYTLSEDLSELQQMTLVSLKDTTEINLNYLERQPVNGFNTPLSAMVSINTPKQQFSVELNYTKTRVNEAEEIQYVIPESYEECK